MARIFYQKFYNFGGLGTEFAKTTAMDKVYIQKSSRFPPAAARSIGAAATFSDLYAEAVRKSIHFLIALSPAMAAINFKLTVSLLIAGIAGYTALELLRLSGINVPVVSAVTRMASRQRDMGHFVAGPVTVGFGALFALLWFPPFAAAIGIYALAFGDGFARLMGKLYGRIRPAFLNGKSIEGSMACYAAVFISAYLVSRNFHIAFTAGLVAALIEALPLDDYDNIAIPLAVCIAVQFVLA
jgi:dolichol kinase